MNYSKIIAKIGRFVPRALAGDPTAIATLAAAGVVIAAGYIAEKIRDNV